MIRVYVAGAYSADNVIDLLANMRRGIRLAVQVQKLGFAPYVPWEDFTRHLRASFTLEDCYGVSMAWLEVSQAVIVVPEGQEQSSGTQAEIARANELGIPVFDKGGVMQRLEALLLCFRNRGKAEITEGQSQQGKTRRKHGSAWIKRFGRLWEAAARAANRTERTRR